MSDDNSKIEVKETFKLEKFEGDDTTQEPFETIEIEMVNGVVVSRRVIRKGEENAINKSG